MLTAPMYRECAWALLLLLVMPLVGGEPSGYHSNLETAQADAQLRGEVPCTDAIVTARARTMAADLCTASLKEAAEMHARVRELEHKLQWT